MQFRHSYTRSLRHSLTFHTVKFALLTHVHYRMWNAFCTIKLNAQNSLVKYPPMDEWDRNGIAIAMS